MGRWRAVIRPALGIALLGLLLTLGWAAPASGQAIPDPGDGGPADPDTPGAFEWHDLDMMAAFETCMGAVDAVARGREGEAPGDPAYWPWQEPPAGVDGYLWQDAVNSDYFMVPHVDPSNDRFGYRPRCHLLLPNDYETRVPVRYHSDVYTRCLAVVGGDTSQERPQVVPAWYWEVSKEIGDCYLLLPLRAFGVGDVVEDEENAWSGWTAGDEADDPDSHEDPEIVDEYGHCLDFIDWRMDGGATFAGLGDLYDDPPSGASPERVWHEAIHYYESPTQTGGLDDVTVPANWKPNCALLLTTESCEPSGPSNPSLLPEACIGPHPMANYDIGYSQYDDPDEEGVPSISRNIWGASTQYAFMIAKGGIQVALWAVDWAYNFDVSQYNPIALQVGDDYGRLLDLPEIHRLFWLMLVGWAGFMALRGRFAVAGSELLVTVVLVLLTTFLLANREMYMNATWRLMEEGETTLLVAGMGEDPEDASAARRAQVIDDLQQQIFHAFIDQPYDYLNWGQSLGKADDAENHLRECAAARYHILSRGPHGGDSWPRQQMADAGSACASLVEFNRNPDGTRLLGAILVMVSALAVAVMLIVVGLTMVVAKVIALLLFAVAPLATLVAVLPAHGRRMTWSWAATLLQVVMAVLGVSFLLSLLLLTLRGLIDMTDEVDLIERFALMDLVVAVVFGARRYLLRSGQSFAARLSEFLSSTRGSGTTWQSAAATAGPGLDLLAVDRTAAYGIGYGVGAPAAVAGRSVLLRAQERRMARRNYRNLERVAYWKRDKNARIARRRAAAPTDRFPPPKRLQPLP